MKLDKLREIISDTNPDQWNHIHCWGTWSGPSYHTRTYKPRIGTSSGTVENVVDSHVDVAILMADIDISIAWGLELGVDDFYDAEAPPARGPEWAQHFDDEDVRVVIGDVFFRGALVDRVFLAVVDSGLSYLPCAREQRSGPDKGKFTTSRWHHDFARLVDQLGGGEEFDASFETAGFVIVD